MGSDEDQFNVSLIGRGGEEGSKVTKTVSTDHSFSAKGTGEANWNRDPSAYQFVAYCIILTFLSKFIAHSPVGNLI